MAQKYRILNFLLISILAEVYGISRKLQAVDAENDQLKIYQGLIMGVGVGTFIVLIAAGLGVLICFIKGSF